MRRLSKENLMGRVVGYSVPYRPDPCQLDEGDPEVIYLTVWGRICHPLVLAPGAFVGYNIHTDDVEIIQTTNIHTIMPRKRYEHL